jgi:hypothetical protein
LLIFLVLYTTDRKPEILIVAVFGYIIVIIVNISAPCTTRIINGRTPPHIIVINKMAAINDKSFLAAMNTIIDTKSEKLIYRTTPEKRMVILK